MRDLTKHVEIVLSSTIFAIVLLFIPLQHSMTLSRFQHYSISLFVWSAGFLIQSVLSWRVLDKWGRLCLLSTGLYSLFLSGALYSNPWLDPRIQIQTSEQEALRQLHFAGWTTVGVILAVFWTIWGVDELNLRNKPKKDSKE
ncbi:MAG: hypothetical protein K2W82_11600 [Candidatus Obscuribacterales bacterium]|jgi:hypothetical protein|nr:hypothetical protein [Candidatus Obscuribacterales bacterium]